MKIGLIVSAIYEKIFLKLKDSFVSLKNAVRRFALLIRFAVASKIEDCMKKKLFAFVFFLGIAGTLFAIPNGYGKIKLGMSVDAVKDALKSERGFGYRGDRDVSLVPSTQQTLIETDGSAAAYSFFERCWFQFDDDKLTAITINLNRAKIDYYSVFSSLCEKYGNPNSISPEKSVWSDDSVIMSLEKPLSLKYIDAEAFNEKLEDAETQKTVSEQLRDEFLEGL